MDFGRDGVLDVVVTSQIYTRDPRTCAIFILAWGSVEGLLVFPIIVVTKDGIGDLGSLVFICELHEHYAFHTCYLRT